MAKLDTRELEKWLYDGFELGEVIDWINAGFNDSKTAFSWRNNDFSPEEAKEWHEAGFEPNEADKWIEAGIKIDDVESALEWQDYKFDIKKNFNDIKDYIEAGFMPSEAANDLKFNKKYK